MSATINYARRGGRRTGKRLEVRFFGAGDEVPSAMFDATAGWVWWRVPRGHSAVWLVGEGPDERCARLYHEPGVCEACRNRRLCG